MRIGSDIDDVIFDWYWTAHEYSNVAGINPNNVTPTLWACQDEYGCTLEEWLAAVYPMALDGVYLDRDPIPGSLEGLKRIKDAGHEVHLITSRGAFVHGEIIKRDTTAWVERHCPWVDSLTFSSDKTQPRTEWFLDDLPKNIDKVLVAGIKGVIFDQPWNQGLPGYLRVHSVDEYADMVLEGRHDPLRHAKTLLSL